MSVEQPNGDPGPVRTERCEECGYDMTAMAAWARCPECGCGLRATFINGRPHPDYMESAGAAYRPVMWVVATGGAACLATSVVTVVGMVERALEADRAAAEPAPPDNVIVGRFARDASHFETGRKVTR